MPIDGIFPCPHCGTSVTAWRDNRADGPFFVPDHHDPYQPHICEGAATQLKRIADTMLDLALMVAEGNGHGPFAMGGPPPAPAYTPTPLRPVARRPQPTTTPLTETLDI